MISAFVVATGSLSIALPAIIVTWRFLKIHKSFLPFAIIIVASLINEIISITLIQHHRSNAVNTNLLSLAEGIIWLWQFERWKLFQNKRTYRAIAGLLAAVWLFENIALSKLFTFSSTYSILYCFIHVILSINIVNRQIVEENSRLLTNAKFIICSGNIIFSTYRIVVECFYLFEIKDSNAFLGNIYAILVVVNVFVNLLFALAALWIPTKQKFSLPHSSLRRSSPLSSLTLF